jgi:hypothetical protein
MFEMVPVTDGCNGCCCDDDEAVEEDEELRLREDVTVAIVLVDLVFERWW